MWHQNSNQTTVSGMSAEDFRLVFYSSCVCNYFLSLFLEIIMSFHSSFLLLLTLRTARDKNLFAVNE